MVCSYCGWSLNAYLCSAPFFPFFDVNIPVGDVSLKFEPLDSLRNDFKSPLAKWLWVSAMFFNQFNKKKE